MNWKRLDWLAVSNIVTVCVSWSVVLILAVALTLLLLTGCSTPSATVQLDSRLTAPCERPTLQGPTNRDIWIFAVEQQEALDDICTRMDAIRQETRR
jgi:uncharacterized lipoprotein YajG